MSGNKKTYSFTIVVKQYQRKNCTLDDMRVIYSGNTCICAKNHKVDGFYLHKNAEIIKGKFHYVAGSHRYPILMPKSKEVHIRVTDFHSKPDIQTDQYVKQDIIQVIDVEET